MEKTHTGEGPACPGRSRGDQHRRDDGRILECSPAPLHVKRQRVYRTPQSTLRRTVCDCAYEAVNGRGAVEEHTGRHGLLPHEVTGDGR